jgi:hypothetical protein
LSDEAEVPRILLEETIQHKCVRWTCVSSS